MPRLKDHLLQRLLRSRADPPDLEQEFTSADRQRILFRNEKLYQHKVVRINFTTYDVRRSQDSLNPRSSHCDVLVQAQEDTHSPNYHPFWYARIVGIFHANVFLAETDGSVTTPFQTLHFLWVRWFGRDLSRRTGVHRYFERIGFVTEDDDTDPFGFVDPADVIRACHLIPAFTFGRTEDLLPPSIGRSNPDERTDWQWYYVAK